MAVVLGSDNIQGAASISGSGTTYGIQQSASGVISHPKVPAASVRMVGNANPNGAGLQNFSNLSSVNVTVQASPGRITVPAAGKYFVAARQLLTITGSMYMYIQKNGSLIAYAYGNDDITYDMWISSLVDMAANDYIDIVYDVYGSTNPTTWTDGHSFLTVYKVT